MYKELVQHQQLKFDELRAKSKSKGKKKRSSKSREIKSRTIQYNDNSRNQGVILESGMSKINKILEEEQLHNEDTKLGTVDPTEGQPTELQPSQTFNGSSFTMKENSKIRYTDL